MTKAKNDGAQLFSFQVEMTVHLFATDEKTAREQLDSQGGFVPNGERKVTLLSAQDLPKPAQGITLVKDE